jgi:hypothetical protein
MQIVKITQSPRSDKKFCALFPSGHHIYFGAVGYEDYTMHGDAQRKERYLQRHAKNENWNNVESAGYLSRWFLWNKKTLRESIMDVNRRQKTYKFVFG